MKRLFTAVAMLVVAVAVLMAQDSYNRRVYKVGNDSLPYRELVPQKMSQDVDYPLIIFLHGAGERGIDNEKQLTHGAQMFLNPINRDKYKAYVLFPQCPEDGYWAYDSRPQSFVPDSMPIQEEPTTQVKLLRGLILNYVKNYNVDPNRVYVMGLSMGGMAVYDIVARYPQLFAAAVPICGTVNPERLKDVRGVKFRIYHGDADNVVTVEGSRRAYLELKEHHVNVNYFEFPGITHGSWVQAFNDPDLLKWMFKCIRSDRD